MGATFSSNVPLVRQGVASATEVCNSRGWVAEPMGDAGAEAGFVYAPDDALSARIVDQTRRLVVVESYAGYLGKYFRVSARSGGQTLPLVGGVRDLGEALRIRKQLAATVVAPLLRAVPGAAEPTPESAFESMKSGNADVAAALDVLASGSSAFFSSSVLRLVTPWCDRGATLDVLLIHGLDGHAVSTWAPDPARHWVRDRLFHSEPLRTPFKDGGAGVRPETVRIMTVQHSMGTTGDRMQGLDDACFEVRVQSDPSMCRVALSRPLPRTLSAYADPRSAGRSACGLGSSPHHRPQSRRNHR